MNKNHYSSYDENDNKLGIAAEEVLRREYDAQEDSRKLEEAHIMSIGEDDTHWGFDALTVHSKPRARRNRWDAGPPPYTVPGQPPDDIDASSSLATGQPTADIDAAQTHFTHTHATRTY